MCFPEGVLVFTGWLLGCLTVDSNKLEHGRRMISACCPSVLVLGLEDGHVPALLQRVVGGVLGIIYPTSDRAPSGARLAGVVAARCGRCLKLRGLGMSRGTSITLQPKYVGPDVKLKYVWSIYFCMAISRMWDEKIGKY